MRMTKPILITPPAAEPVTLAEAKAHLRLEIDADDGLVAALIAAARSAVENETRRVLMAQTWRTAFSDWPEAGVALPVVPVLSVEAVRWLDDDGAATVLDEEDWLFDPGEERVRLLAAEPDAASFEIDFIAGYGETGGAAPAPLRQAILMLLAHWYEHRSAAISGALEVVPTGVRALIAPYRRMALA